MDTTKLRQNKSIALSIDELKIIDRIKTIDKNISIIDIFRRGLNEYAHDNNIILDV